MISTGWWTGIWVSWRSALQRLPVPERDHLVGEIREHITELRAEKAPRDAWDMEALLNRVGLPEDIAAAALENVEEADDVVGAGSRSRSRSGARRCSRRVDRDDDACPAVVPAITPPRGTGRGGDRARGGRERGGRERVATRHGSFVGSPGTPSLVVPATHPSLPPTPSRVTVPNVIGMSVAQATAELQAADLLAGSISGSSNALPAGEVFSQSPAAGSFVAPGSMITLEVSSGPPS